VCGGWVAAVMVVVVAVVVVVVVVVVVRVRMAVECCDANADRSGPSKYMVSCFLARAWGASCTRSHSPSLQLDAIERPHHSQPAAGAHTAWVCLRRRGRRWCWWRRIYNAASIPALHCSSIKPTAAPRSR